MPAIGSISCDLLRGYPPGPLRRVETWQRPGVDGVGALDLGSGGNPIRLVASVRGVEAAVITFAAALEALVGSAVVITPELGTARTVLITRVGQPATECSYPYGYWVDIEVEGLVIA